HLEGFHISLHDRTLGNRPCRESGLHEKVDVIKASMAMMAAESEKDHSHGFAMLCKKNDITDAPYVITIANVSGFASIERHFHDEGFETIADLPIIGRHIHEINEGFCNKGFSASTLKAYSRAKGVLEKICSPRIECPDSWLNLQAFTNFPHVDKVHIELWGVFKEKYFEMISDAAEDSDCLNLSDVDLIQCVIDGLMYESYEHIRVGRDYE
ncbi:TPA: hypothetical protein ACIVM6_004371, partial [Salmonella enterica subsp. salamae serovar 21:z10:z6]